MIVPLVYFVAAHVALIVAMMTVARDPAAVMVYLQPAVAGTVHLITLGWITGTILGAIYVVGPLALRLTIRIRWIDYVALFFYLLGASGLVAHFWIAEYSGMAGSAAMVWVAVVLVLGRLWDAIHEAPLDGPIRLHLALCCANFVAAGGMGLLLALNRMQPLFASATVGVTYAHAHLAAIGWATLLAIGVGYRVLPMVLPARPPKGPRLTTGAWLVEAGVIALVPALIVHSRWALLGALLIVGGLAHFGIEAVGMFRRRLPPNPQIRLPLIAPLHVGLALAHLAVAALLGIALAWLEPGPRTLRLAFTYGVIGLIGFLGQLIAAVQARLVPLIAWYWVAQRRGPAPPLQSPYTLPAWRAEPISAGLWIAGTFGLVAGAWQADPDAFSTGAALVATAGAVGLIGLLVTTLVAFLRETRTATSPMSRAVTSPPPPTCGESKC